MPLKRYGVLKGRPIRRMLGQGSSPHYQIHMIDETTDYRIAVNWNTSLMMNSVTPSPRGYLASRSASPRFRASLGAWRSTSSVATS